MTSELSKEYVEGLELPRWSGLLVVGERVTRRQAAEMIVRTHHLSYIGGNDRQFRAEICEAYGLGKEPEWDSSLTPEARQEVFAENLRLTEIARRKYHTVLLSNLGLGQRIVSSWVGGPHGWLNWDGTVFSDNYNIGKHPSCGATFEEWAAIAKAFPFLTLKAQLLDREICEEGHRPVVEFHVAAGKVTAHEPQGLLLSPNDNMEELYASFADSIRSNTREHGCTLHQLKQALAWVVETNPEPFVGELDYA